MRWSAEYYGACVLWVAQCLAMCIASDSVLPNTRYEFPGICVHDHSDDLFQPPRPRGTQLCSTGCTLKSSGPTCHSACPCCGEHGFMPLALGKWTQCPTQCTLQQCRFATHCSAVLWFAPRLPTMNSGWFSCNTHTSCAIRLFAAPVCARIVPTLTRAPEPCCCSTALRPYTGWAALRTYHIWLRWQPLPHVTYK